MSSFREIVRTVLLSSVCVFVIAILFLSLTTFFGDRFPGGAVLGIAIVFCLGVLAGAMGNEPRKRPVIEFLTRGWRQAWMCVLLGLIFALCGAATIGKALVAIDRRFFNLWSSPNWSGSLVSDVRIWQDWSAGSVLLLFGGVLGTIGVREITRRFRTEK